MAANKPKPKPERLVFLTLREIEVLTQIQRGVPLRDALVPLRALQHKGVLRRKPDGQLAPVAGVQVIALFDIYSEGPDLLQLN